MVKPKKTFNPKTFLTEVGEGRAIHRYSKNEIVFSQGDLQMRFFILKGQVRINNGFPTGEGSGHRDLRG